MGYCNACNWINGFIFRYLDALSTIMDRIVIYPKDIERITGCSPRTACSKLANIKKYFGKQKHQPVSITEFCLYMGMSREEVLECLK